MLVHLVGFTTEICKYHCYLCFVYVKLNKIISINNVDKLARMLDLGMLLSKSDDSDHLCTLHCNIKTTTALTSHRSDITLLREVALTISLYLLK